MPAGTEIKKDYLTLTEVSRDCNVPMEDLRYLGEEGRLAICLRRIPIKLALESILKNNTGTTTTKDRQRILEMLKSPPPLHPTDIYKIFSIHPNKIDITLLKTIPNIKNTQKKMTPLVGFDDLIIMREEKERFAYNFLNQKNTMMNPLVIISPDFKNFILYNHEYFFGEKQARIIKFLYEKYMNGDPWVHSKTLLDVADSHSWRLHNLFSHNKDWRNVIRGGKNGYYMFNLPTNALPPAIQNENAGLDLFDCATNTNK